MATITKEFLLDASAERVWEALKDFGALHTRLAPGFVIGTELEGTVRIVTFSNGSVAREELVTMDDGARRLVYAIKSERLAHHNASVQVAAAGPHCRFLWTTDVLPDAVAPYIDGQMALGVEAMRKNLAIMHLTIPVCRPRLSAWSASTSQFRAARTPTGT